MTQHDRIEMNRKYMYIQSGFSSVQNETGSEPRLMRPDEDAQAPRQSRNGQVN